jgi:selenoprotein W-related protein
LAAAIQKEFEVESELIKSSGGVFEVKAENQLIFSKKQSGRFPSEIEVIEAMKKLK